MSCARADELEPPWSRYPWIPCGSIGWRMGIGESYQIEWGEWATPVITDPDAAFAYLRRHPAAPRTWVGWIASWLADLAGVAEAAETDDPWRRRVIDEELVGDDVAYPVFVRNAEREGGMRPPWTWRGEQAPSTTLRYSARELGWWARWLATECADRAAYLDGQPAPPAAWSRIAAAARRGAMDPPMLDGAEAMVATLAATGTLPPPWLAGRHPPGETRYDEDLADDRDRWSWWASEMFEDEPSWRAYLTRWDAPPATWVEWLEGDDCCLPFRDAE